MAAGICGRVVVLELADVAVTATEVVVSAAIEVEVEPLAPRPRATRTKLNASRTPQLRLRQLRIQKGTLVVAIVGAVVGTITVVEPESARWNRGASSRGDDPR